MRLTRTAPRFGKPLKSWVYLIVLAMSSTASAASFTVNIPADLKVDKASATTEKEPKTTLPGIIKGDTISFADPIAGSAYEVQLTLKDATVLQGIDMGWYSRVPDKANPEPMDDDDRQQMTDVLKKVESFYDVNDLTLLQGNHNRAVMLVDLERGRVKTFHSDSGGEIIWRPELWYFENHHGGWEKILQGDRVVRRERFKNLAEYHAVLDHLRWVPELGGLKSTPKKPDVTVTLQSSAVKGVATTQPSIPAAGQSHPSP